MTIGAIVRGLRKRQVVVASDTLDLFMFTGQRKSCFVMSELGVCRNLFPVSGRVAARTIKLDVAVRIVTLGDCKDCEAGGESDCQADS